MNPPEFFLLLMAVLLSVAGQIFLKFGALQLGAVNASNLVTQIFKIATTYELIIGLMFYGFGAIAYILVLTRVPLSTAGPAASMIYIFTVVSGSLFFNEAITAAKILGLVTITIGVLIISLKS
ncbi:EamA-like family transporter [Leptolyngbya sp. PCC 7375]|nr:EamA-like family transporter [Leptolyngbya sp. PCC 7375]